MNNTDVVSLRLLLSFVGYSYTDKEIAIMANKLSKSDQAKILRILEKLDDEIIGIERILLLPNER